MLVKLLLLMTVVPAVELWLLLLIGKQFGVMETIWLIVLTGIVGAALAKREGLAVIRQIQEDALNGKSPADRLVEGLLVLVGGILLLTPGVVTDVTGLLMIIPLSRRPLARWTKGALSDKVVTWGMNIGPAGPGPAARQTRETLNQGDSGEPGDGHFDHPVL